MRAILRTIEILPRRAQEKIRRIQLAGNEYRGIMNGLEGVTGKKGRQLGCDDGETLETRGLRRRKESCASEADAIRRAMVSDLNQNVTTR
jgi:hypothetical protein